MTLLTFIVGAVCGAVLMEIIITIATDYQDKKAFEDGINFLKQFYGKEF